MNQEKIIDFLDQDFNLVIGKVLGLIASQFSKNTAKNIKQSQIKKLKFLLKDELNWQKKLKLILELKSVNCK